MERKEKTLGPASMPKHEAQEKLAGYITEYTGRLTKRCRQRRKWDSLSSFGRTAMVILAGDSSGEGGRTMIKSDAQRDRTLAQIGGFRRALAKMEQDKPGNAPPQSAGATKA